MFEHTKNENKFFGVIIFKSISLFSYNGKIFIKVSVAAEIFL